MTPLTTLRGSLALDHDSCRAFIVADIRLYREALARALDRDSGFSVVGFAASADSAVAEVGDCASDVVLLDTEMPGAAARYARSLQSGPRRASSPSPSSTATTARSAGRTPAWPGTSPARRPFASSRRPIDAVAPGKAGASPPITAGLLRRIAVPSADGLPRERMLALTVREREILGLIQSDLLNKEIASRLVIEVATVKNGNLREVTGRAGNVVLAHPFLVHARGFTHRRPPRIISNTKAPLVEPLDHGQPDPADCSVLELSIGNTLRRPPDVPKGARICRF
jgi:DNA-binding NarL/FixJ family response regulator